MRSARLFRVNYTSASSHVLQSTGTYSSSMPLVIRVFYRAGQNVRYGLLPSVRMHGEASVLCFRTEFVQQEERVEMPHVVGSDALMEETSWTLPLLFGGEYLLDRPGF